MRQYPATPVAPPSTTPTRKKFHGSPLRGIDTVAASSSTAGRFGRMFRNIPVFEHRVDNLAALARTMIVPARPVDTEPVPVPAPPDEQENPLIPAGYTYLGQFIDHDLTFDPVSSLQRQNDPDALHNFRTPRYDLDCLYGRGPADQPYLYRSGSKSAPHPVLGFDQRGVMFLEGEKRGNPQDAADAPFIGPDLPRNSEGRALIGDPRNDENLIVSQLHATFLRFHNRMTELVFEECGMTGNDLFKEAQRRVRWHYQWIVVKDFLPRIIDGASDGKSHEGSVVDDILRPDKYATSGGTGNLLRPKLHFYRWREQPFLPIEFSVAAYRFGHSMVRPSYFINDFVRQQNNNARIPLFSASEDPLANLTGFRPLPDKWGFQWKYFFDLEPTFAPQHSYKIDTRLSTPLGTLPGQPDMANLAERNLVRGLRLGLPSGQNVARAMGIQPLSDSDLGLGERGAPDFDGDAPLWFYVLREAELLASSRHLGPVGGRIVAEVFIGLLMGDPLSWLNIEPDWQPPLARNGKFGMPELIRFALGNQFTSPTPQMPSDALARWRATFH
jgi:Animal haem peroxidase